MCNSFINIHAGGAYVNEVRLNLKNLFSWVNMLDVSRE